MAAKQYKTDEELGIEFIGVVFSRVLKDGRVFLNTGIREDGGQFILTPVSAEIAAAKGYTHVLKYDTKAQANRDAWKAEQAAKKGTQLNVAEDEI